MRLSKEQLKQIIKEELEIISEAELQMDQVPMRLRAYRESIPIDAKTDTFQLEEMMAQMVAAYLGVPRLVDSNPESQELQMYVNSLEARKAEMVKSGESIHSPNHDPNI